MSIVTTQPVYGTGKIGYKNLLTLGTVTTSSGTKENLYDWKMHTWWTPTSTGDSWVKVDMGSAATVNYFAVAAHNLGSLGNTVKLQYSTNGTTWSDATTALSESNDRVIFSVFDDILARYWRVLMNCPSTISSIGVAAFGERVDLPRGFPSGFVPPALGRVSDYHTSVSENGQFIGRSRSNSLYKTRFSLPQLEPGWVRSTWEDFADHAEIKPFFFSWDNQSYSTEVVIAWMTGNYIPPSYDTTTTMAASMDIGCKR